MREDVIQYLKSCGFTKYFSYSETTCWMSEDATEDVEVSPKLIEYTVWSGCSDSVTNVNTLKELMDLRGGRR